MIQYSNEVVLDALKSVNTEKMSSAVIKDNVMEWGSGHYYHRTADSNTHFINIDIGNHDYVFITVWDDRERIGLMVDNDQEGTFDDTSVCRMTKIFSTEEEHFQESLLKDVKVPYSIIEEVIRVRQEVIQQWNKIQ